MSENKLNELYVVLGTDSSGEEGVASYFDPEKEFMVPLVGSLKSVPNLQRIAQALATSSKRDLVLAKFTQRGNLETIRPVEEE